jgi:integrase
LELNSRHFVYAKFIAVKFLVKKTRRKFRIKSVWKGKSNYSEVIILPKAGKNIYKRKDGRWEGRYPKHRDSNGKTIYGSVYGGSCTEVKRRLVAIKADVHVEKPCVTVTNSHILTFTDAVEQWLSATALKVKPSTYAGYTSMLDLHILPSFGRQRIHSVTSLEINRFAKEKLECGRADGRGGLSPKTVRDMLSIIKSVMDFAWSEKTIANRIIITYPKQHQEAIRVLSRQEQAALEAALTADINIHKLGILLCLYTGIRIGEVCALLWQDISSDYDMLSVRQTMQRIKNLGGDGNKTKIIIDTPKSLRSVRVIPIPTFISPLLRSFFAGNHTHFLGTDDVAFAEPRTMQNHFAKIITAANIPDANYHALRHTFATRCIEAGVDIKSLSEMLGHANVNITLNRYVHSSFEQKREGMKKLERHIGNEG